MSVASSSGSSDSGTLDDEATRIVEVSSDGSCDEAGGSDDAVEVVSIGSSDVDTTATLGFALHPGPDGQGFPELLRS
eukprot:2829306-Karenia_brevis.AAC.1